MKRKVKIIRSNRKRMVLEVTPTQQVIVRAPLDTPVEKIQQFVNDKTPWIQKTLQELRQKQLDLGSAEKLTEQQLVALEQKAKVALPPKIAQTAQRLGVTYGKVYVKRLVSRWGSCTYDGNLNFNCLLMLCPDNVVDYLVAHELSHRVHMNHSADFWRVVASVCPDYKQRRAWLKQNGGSIIRRYK